MNKILSDITSEQVLAWLKAKADASGIEKIELIASTYGWFLACDRSPLNTPSQDSADVDEAIAKLRAKIPNGEQLAQQKRDEAHRLLAEAEALDAEGKS